jgi:hypothetical protein
VVVVAYLHPVRQRLDWAERHLRSLEGVITSYAAQRPFAVETRLVEGRQRRVVRATLTEPAPVEASLVFGDYVHNLRSCLDHLVGVLRAGGASDHSAFPVSEVRSTFERKAHTQLEGVPDWARAKIHDIQPFPENERRWVGLELLALDRLWNRDKHRALLLGAAVVQPSSVGVRDLGSFMEGSRYARDWDSWVAHGYPDGLSANFTAPGGSVAEADVPSYAGASFVVRVVLRESVPVHHGPGGMADLTLDQDLAGFARRLYNVVAGVVIPEFDRS